MYLPWATYSDTDVAHLYELSRSECYLILIIFCVKNRIFFKDATEKLRAENLESNVIIKNHNRKVTDSRGKNKPENLKGKFIEIILNKIFLYHLPKLDSWV